MFHDMSFLKDRHREPVKPLSKSRVREKQRKEREAEEVSAFFLGQGNFRNQRSTRQRSITAGSTIDRNSPGLRHSRNQCNTDSSAELSNFYRKSADRSLERSPRNNQVGVSQRLQNPNLSNRPRPIKESAFYTEAGCRERATSMPSWYLSLSDISFSEELLNTGIFRQAGVDIRRRHRRPELLETGTNRGGVSRGADDELPKQVDHKELLGGPTVVSCRNYQDEDMGRGCWPGPEGETETVHGRGSDPKEAHQQGCDSSGSSGFSDDLYKEGSSTTAKVPDRPKAPKSKLIERLASACQDDASNLRNDLLGPCDRELLRDQRVIHQPDPRMPGPERIVGIDVALPTMFLSPQTEQAHPGNIPASTKLLHSSPATPSFHRFGGFEPQHMSFPRNFPMADGHQLRLLTFPSPRYAHEESDNESMPEVVSRLKHDVLEEILAESPSKLLTVSQLKHVPIDAADDSIACLVSDSHAFVPISDLSEAEATVDTSARGSKRPPRSDQTALKGVEDLMDENFKASFWRPNSYLV